MSLAYDPNGILHSAKGIPIRNVWLLMLYASECFAHIEHSRAQTGTECLPKDEHWPDIIAEILIHFVRERLLRGLTRNSMPREQDLNRVRGSIHMLRTESHQLLARGRVACRFHESTLDTVRNRYIKAALEKGACITRGKVGNQCRDYAALLFRMGVAGGLPDRQSLSKEVDTLNNREDRMVMAAARLLLDMALPQTQEGQAYLPLPSVEEKWLRSLFEKAIRGFYRVVAKDWHVEPSNVQQNWPVAHGTEFLELSLPKMKLDIVLRHKGSRHKTIIDTKFTSLLKSGWYRDASLSSAYIYQMYAYLRTQEERSEPDRVASGILLHPATEATQYFSCLMQGHRIIFATVNLHASAQEIRQELLSIMELSHLNVC